MMHVPAHRHLLAVIACLALVPASGDAGEPLPDVVPVLSIELSGDVKLEFTEIPSNLIPGFIPHVCISEFNPNDVSCYFLRIRDRKVIKIDVKRKPVEITE